MDVSRGTSGWLNWTEHDILCVGAGQMGLDLTEEQAGRLVAFLTDLRQWNKKMNLIGPATAAEQVVVHLLDALSPLPFLGNEVYRLMDLGSGGGLPGLVLKMVRPAWDVTLVEARAKKALFLRQMIRARKLDAARVLEARLGPDPRPREVGRFDLITVRAVGTLVDVLPLVGPLLSGQGLILAYKGPGAGDELEASAKRLKDWALRLDRIERLRLPFLGHERTLIFFKPSGRSSAGS